jgi:hypothetical protein
VRNHPGSGIILVEHPFEGTLASALIAGSSLVAHATDDFGAVAPHSAPSFNPIGRRP